VTLPQPKHRILSLGAGVQSSTVLLMSCLGNLPKLDAAIFADTGWEPKAVYRHLEWLTREAARFAIPVHRISVGNIREDALRSQVRGKASNGSRWASMPYYVLGPNGEQGMIRRQCTKEYKLTPIRRWVRKWCGYELRQRIPNATLEQWIGISADEAQRQRGSGVMWILNWHPLLEKHITRNGCFDWLAAHGYPEPPRSACIGCPFHSAAEWRWLQQYEAESFDEACEFDDAIRNCGGVRGQIFLHSARIPLREVDFRTRDEKSGQRLLCPTCFM